MKTVAPNLSGDSLIQSLKSAFERVPDHRNPLLIKFKLSDILMSAFSIFSLKFPSLLKFEEEMRARNHASRLGPIYKIEGVPSDTQMRSVLDCVNSEYLREPFSRLFSKLQRANHLKQFLFYKDKYLLPIDGTGFFSSDCIHCASCTVKKFENGSVLYQHQMLGGCIVHPSMKTVIPLCPEPVRKQDGSTKNDCEQNALKRFLEKLRLDHPKLPLILTADALHTTGPTIRELEFYNIDYILAVKPGSHQKLFEAVARWEEQGQMKYFNFEEEIGDHIKKHRVHEFRYMNGALLNHADVNLSTNFFEYWETTQWVNSKNELKQEVVHLSWVTSFAITTENIIILMRGGRAKWKIENEIFNTLKNQDYKFEHNFGHGHNQLSTNFAYLMFLAFLFDQIQQIGCKRFQSALRSAHRISYLWEDIRGLFKWSYAFEQTFESWSDFITKFTKAIQFTPLDTS